MYIHIYMFVYICVYMYICVVCVCVCVYKIGFDYSIALYRSSDRVFLPPLLFYPFPTFIFSIKVQLIYNVVPISAVQQSDPVIHIYIYVCVYI